MDVFTILLTMCFMESLTEAQFRPPNRGGIFSINPTRGNAGPQGFSILQHLNRPIFPPPPPPGGSGGPRGFSILSNINRPPPLRPGIGHGVPIQLSTTGNVPFIYHTGSNFPSNFNTGSSVPLMFNGGRYFPIFFNTGNTIIPQNINTGNVMELNNGNNFPVNFNTVNNPNAGNSLLSSLNNGGVAVPQFNTRINRPAQTIGGTENPAIGNTQNSIIFSDIFNNGRDEKNSLSNRIDFLDPTNNGNVDLGASHVFSYFGTTVSPPTSFDNGAGITPTLKPEVVIHSEGTPAGVPRDSGHFGSSKLLSGTFSGTTNPTVLKESGSVFDVSHITTEDLGNLEVLQGSNNFKTTNTNTPIFSLTSNDLQVGQNLQNVSSLFNTGGEVTNPVFVPNDSTSTLPSFTPQGSHTPLSEIPPQHPRNPTSTFDLMGNMAGPFHDPLMFFGLNQIMDLDIMDNTFFNAISNPISANAALQMRVQATPSINLMTSPISNTHTSNFLFPPPSHVSSAVNMPTNSPIRNTDQIVTRPNVLQQVSQPQSMFTGQASNAFQPQFSQTQRSRIRSQNPFNFNWNPVMARPAIPPGVQFLSQTIPGMTENFFSRNMLPAQRSSWFDPTFGVALDESHSPAVKKTKLSQEKVKGKTQPISVGNHASKPIRVRAMAKADLQNPEYTNTLRK